MDASPSNVKPPWIVENPLVYPGRELPSRPIEEEYYDVKYDKMGIMLIFNQYDFPGANRDGTEKDLEKLKETFLNIGYDVRDFTDKKSETIKEKLKEVAGLDHSNNMSLIIVMLTHGDSGGILYTYDTFIQVEDLWKPFTADKCPSLAGKPKLFFIQACKGDLVDPGSIAELKVPSETAFASKSAKLKEKELRTEKFVIPTMADILMFFSTAEGYPSFRSQNGSWQGVNILQFKNCLCKRFSEYLKDEKEEDLTRILNATSRDVAFGHQAVFKDPLNEEDKKYDAVKQMPTIMTTLTRFLVFNKK